MNIGIIGIASRTPEKLKELKARAQPEAGLAYFNPLTRNRSECVTP